MVAGVASLLLTLAILVAFIGGVRRGAAAIIVIRPICDRLFEQARFDVAGHSLSFGAVLNFIVIGAMLLSVRRISNREQIVLERAWVPFLLIAFVAVLYSPVQVDGFRKFLTYVSYMAMFVLPFALVKTKASAEHFFRVVILSSVLPVLYGLYQLVSGRDWYQGNRVASTFMHPNIFAFFLLAIVGTVLTLLATNRVQLSPRVRQVLTIYLIPLLVLLVVTKTRSAWIGCLVMFVVYGIVQDKRVLVASLLLPVVALTVPAVRDRLTALASGNEYVGWVESVNPYAWRRILWEKAFPLILEQPLFGHGLYSFPFYSPTFFPLESTRGVDAHNVYVQLLFETGLAGLIGYLWIFWRQFLLLARHRAFDPRGVTMVAVMLSVFLITCYSDNMLEYVSYGWCYWFIAGLVFADLSQCRAAAPARLGWSGDFLSRAGAGNA